jgi:transcriptional regulator with XRE-family HTH domain
MKLKDPAFLRQLMKDRDISQAKLAREAGVSRQFIHQLLTNPRKNTCRDATGLLIEEALGVERGLLFMRMVSSENGQPVQRGMAVGAA